MVGGAVEGLASGNLSHWLHDGRGIEGDQVTRVISHP